MIFASFRRNICLFLTILLLLSMFPASVRATEETTEPSTEATTETTEAPTEETSEPTEESSEPTEESSEPAEESSEPTVESSEPVSDPTEESSEPGTVPSEESTGSTEITEESSAPTEETPPAEPVASVEEDYEPLGAGLYFGQFYSHVRPSGDPGFIESTFLQASETENLDFFAVSDHSNSFDNANLGNLTADASTISTSWADGKAAAEAVTRDDFVGMFGFEMSWPEDMQLGHISTFNTPGFQSWQQDAYKQEAFALQNYYNTLSSLPDSVSRFNHPGNQYGTFSQFGHYSEAADRVIMLLDMGTGSLDTCKFYIQALDAGWHVAPTVSTYENINTARTVVYAQSLTETDLYDAMRNYRVYATEDTDLEIFSSMDGHFMGSQLKLHQIGQYADLSVSLFDPTDDSIGQVEVITDGGTVAKTATITQYHGSIAFSLSTDASYYFLRITQPDGDVAVTAPIWIDQTESLGISGLTCRTSVPVQGETVSLDLELYNQESVDFVVESLEFLADGAVFAEDTSLTEVPAETDLTHRTSFCYDGIGQTEITVRLTGTLGEAEHSFTESLSLSFRQSSQVTAIYADGSHENLGLTELSTLKSMASKEDILLTVLEECPSAETLADCRFLLITPPEMPFADAFLEAVTEYVRYGGSLVICGQSAQKDGEIASAGQLNRLLEAIGSTVRLNSDTVTDAVSNGGRENLLFLSDIQKEDPWCSGITSDQVYRLDAGCSLRIGSGNRLVNTDDGKTVLAREETSAGGTVFVAGSLFFGSTDLTEPKNIWDEPYANRTFAENLLGIGGDTLPLTTIADARRDTVSPVLRIRGYVTAGTSNPYNQFSETLYLQDDTGGIAVMPFTQTGISIGTPMEITGVVQNTDGNPVLKPVSWEVLDATAYRYLPLTGDWKTILDTDAHSGELVQIEGTCTEVLRTDEGTLSRFTLKDSSGNLAEVLIEPYIFAGSSGENKLHKQVKKNRTVRAMGLLHVDEDGNTVIRVRNCEEVVYVPPRRYYIPKTGDPVSIPCTALALSSAALLLLKKKKIQ